MEITLNLPNWRTSDIMSKWDTSEDYLVFLLRAVQFTHGKDKELLLQEIDQLHHYHERTLGRSYHGLLAYQHNFSEVYSELEKKRWRLSYLSDEIPYDVEGTYTQEKLQDGTIVSTKQVRKRKLTAPF
jgi:hypothetical protein